VKLRNVISQGMVIDPSILLTPEQINTLSSEEITQLLKVEKYEPPLNIIQAGILTDLPHGFSKYDIEGCERYHKVVDSLRNQEVLVSEKMEGTNFSVCKDHDGKIHVNQRDNSIVELDGVENWFWTVAKHYDLINKVSQMPNGSGVYAELCGPKVQKNIYNLKQLTLFVFDIKKNGK
jgi:RNA ligase (TIGR02306 family)